MSRPRTLEQEPINVGEPNYDPLFPFGYGLTDSSGHGHGNGHHHHHWHHHGGR